MNLLSYLIVYVAWRDKRYGDVSIVMIEGGAPVAWSRIGLNVLKIFSFR